jgi:D-glycero-D-manno-heptose 1,7-bisphosphate phosphatase
MMDINGKPFLEYLVCNVARCGFNRFLFLCGHRGRQIEDYFGKGDYFGVTIAYAFEEQLAGTGGALLNASSLLAEEFLLLNGDTYFNINYSDLFVQQPKGQWIVKMALRAVPDATRYGSVHLYHDKVIGFSEKSSSGSGLVNGGVYWMKRRILSYIRQIPSSMEKDVLPLLARDGLVWGWPYQGFFIDIGTPEDLQRAAKALPLINEST